jgi:hypothetical protein
VTGRGLCVTGRVRSVFSVCVCLGFLIGRGDASGHDRSNASGRYGILLDSNRTLALWRPVHLACTSGHCFAGALLGWTSASDQLRDQRVRSSVAHPVMLRAWMVYAPAHPVSLTSASGQRDCSVFKCPTTLFEGVCL